MIKSKPKIMRLQIFIFLFFFINSLFGQDSITKLKLKPIITISFPYKTTDEKTEIEKKTIRDKKLKLLQDSLDNTEFCKKMLADFKLLRKNNYEKIIEIGKKVKELNEENKNSGFYYYIEYICLSSNFNFQGCSGVSRIRNSDDCDEFELKIKKKEKDRLILDGPSGEVFYYEDIKRTPTK